MNYDTRNLERLSSMIQGVQSVTLTTLSPEGEIHSRPMCPLAANFTPFEGILWFFSRGDSQKNHEIEADQHVGLTYFDSEDERFVSISGVAILSKDRAKMEELWDPSVSTWIPEGLADPQVSLIGVRVEKAQTWDSRSGTASSQRGQGQPMEFRQ